MRRTCARGARKGRHDSAPVGDRERAGASTRVPEHLRERQGHSTGLLLAITGFVLGLELLILAAFLQLILETLNRQR